EPARLHLGRGHAAFRALTAAGRDTPRARRRATRRRGRPQRRRLGNLPRPPRRRRARPRRMAGGLRALRRRGRARPRPAGRTSRRLQGRSAGSTSERRREMTNHRTGTREEWLAARLELLEAEKELTRRSDELAKQRQKLPWVPIEKDYRFETDEGSASLADLFRGRSQLLMRSE